MTSDPTSNAAADPQKLISSSVAETILGNKESWTRKMFELAAQLRRDGGGPVYDLSLGNPSLEPPLCWREQVSKLVMDTQTSGQHRYMTNAGFPDVRAFIAEREAGRYGIAFTGDDVLMSVGAAGAINVVFRSVLNPGDEVLIPAPYFSEYEHYCANAGAKLVAVRTNEDFSLDCAAIESAITSNTRIVVLNSPNNPTGAIYSAQSLKELSGALVKSAQKYGRPIYVVEDSPYRDLVYETNEHVASMCEVYNNSIFITSHSKDLGLAGERIGYALISPRSEGRDLLRRAMSFCNRVLGFVNAPALMQRALPGVLGHPEGRVDVGVYADNCRRMATGLRELGFVIPEPKAGFFLFPRLPDAMRNADPEGCDVALTEKLRAQRTIVVPGTAFGVPAHLRLSMCVDPAVVEPALKAFQSVC